LLHPVAEVRRQSRYLLSLRPLDNGDGAERQETDHRADLEPRRGSVRQAQDVVIKAVFFVPHAIRADRVQSARDQQELDPEVCRQILVNRVMRSELAGDLEHVLAKQRDRGSAVGLLQIPAGR